MVETDCRQEESLRGNESCPKGFCAEWTVHERQKSGSGREAAMNQDKRHRKMRNPLRKRVRRELAGEWAKYLVIALFLIGMIGAVSGMYVANGSMLKAADESVEKYRLEDGHFELKEKAEPELIRAIESGEKADLLSYYKKKAHDKVDEKLGEEFDAKFEESVEKTVREKVTEAITDQVHQAAAAYGLSSEMEQSQLDAALKDQLEAQVSKALPEAVQSAKDSGAYQEAYDKAQEEAYEKADEEVEKKYAEAEDKYDLSDKEFQARPVTVYENFYKETTEVRSAAEEETANEGDRTDSAQKEEAENRKENGTEQSGKIRVYPVRKEIDLACVMDGALPASEDEIAIDRMHADNTGLKVGDRITVGKEAYTISGLVANVDYSTLFEKNTDMMFDAIGFDVGLLTQEGFERIQVPVYYNYSFLYSGTAGDGTMDRADGDIQEKKWSDAFLKGLITQALAGENEVKNYLPTYGNQAVQFTRDDIGGDKAMGGVLLYILVAVLAFVFAITIGNTIQKEASVIGTLRASGYTRGELLRHYMASPVLVTFLSAIVGNLLGYTVFKNVVVSMYYNSYSLPSYVTVFSPEALIKTTVVPVVLMFLVNSVVIAKKLRCTPLQFLRHDLKKTRRKKAMRLPCWGFLARFRLRVLLQNIPGYVVLFLGILFVMLLLAEAVGMPDTLAYYKEKAPDMMIARYQTMLKSWKDDDGEIISTKTEDAEKVGMKTLLRRGEERDEDISVYGIEENSRYVGLPGLSEGEALVSSAYAAKYGVKKGDVITLDAQFEDSSYSFEVAGVQDYDAALAVFLPLSEFRDTFELEPDEFSGFFSDTEITDIPSKYITTVVTRKDITKMVDQLDHSMGAYMLYFQYVCIALSAVLIYLLTKLIIERNENSISMTKILGYRTGEIASIYLLSTTWVVVFSELVSAVLGAAMMKGVWAVMMQGMDGWFSFVIRPAGYGKMLLFVFVGYLFVTILDFRRIRKVPLEEALKNAE